MPDLLRFDFSFNSVSKELRVSCDHYVSPIDRKLPQHPPTFAIFAIFAGISGPFWPSSSSKS